MSGKILHSIKIKLYPSHLTNNDNDFLARVDPERTLCTRDVCVAAVTRGGADATPEVMEKNVNDFLKEMAYQLCNGFSVNTGYFFVSASVRGVFKGDMDTFDPERHLVYFQFRQGPQLRQESKNIRVETMGVADTGSQIFEVIDVRTGSVNDLVTPGFNLRIRGYRLKIVGEHPEVGLRFVNIDNGDVIPVDDIDIVTNRPSELIILTPRLPEGAYKLELVTQFSGNTSILLKNPKKAQFDGVLTVR